MFTSLLNEGRTVEVSVYRYGSHYQYRWICMGCSKRDRSDFESATVEQAIARATSTVGSHICATVIRRQSQIDSFVKRQRRKANKPIRESLRQRQIAPRRPR